VKAVYLDNSATSFPKPQEVHDAVASMMKWGVNADRGGYSLARQTGRVVQQAREAVRDLVGIEESNRVVFAPSATVALNMVLFGLNWGYGDHVYLSPFEHNSVLRPLYRLQQVWRITLRQIPISRKDFVYDLDQLRREFRKYRPKLVVLNHGSNVCGVVAPLKELASLAKEYEALILVDAAQTLGSIPINMVDCNIDYLVFAGHKDLYGPIGVGGIVVNTSASLEPLIYGGTGVESELEDMPLEYPHRLEAGSPNVVAIAGLSAGIDFVKKNQDLRLRKEKLFRLLLEQFQKHPEITTFASPYEKNRLPIAACTVAGYTPQEFATILDRHFNIAVRAGLHCAPKAHQFLGTSPLGAVRFSIGAFNTEQDILAVGEALEQIFN